MIKKCFSFCFYGLVSILCLGKLQACPAGGVDAGAGGTEVAGTGTGFTVHATAEADSITPLEIGDKIPEELWEMAFPVVSPHADNVQYLSLGDFRDKLIILDFWATWCAPCISSLYKLDTLQREFADDLLVFPTSYEAEDKVRKFFADKGYSLPTAFDETHLKKYFPHRIIPHQVWLKDGEVLAVTGPEYATAANIAGVLSGDELKTVGPSTGLDLTSDNFLDRLFGGSIIEAPAYTRLVVPWVDAPVGGSRSRPGQYMVFNSSIPHLFHMAYITEIPFSEKRHRVKLEVSREKRRLMEPLVKTGDYRNDLEVQKIKQRAYFSYILEIPDSLDLEARTKMMREDLERYFRSRFGITAQLEEREVPCYTITIASGGRSVPRSEQRGEAGRDTRSFGTMEDLLGALRYANRHGDRYFIDDTGYRGEVNIVLPDDLGDLDIVEKALGRYGLKVTEEDRPVEVLVIKDIK